MPLRRIAVRNDVFACQSYDWENAQLANLTDQLGEPEQRYFMQLTGIHSRGVSVHTHRDAISYLTLLDMHRRKKRTAQVARAPGLLGMTLGRLP
jgi:hypothetical protein